MLCYHEYTLHDLKYLRRLILGEDHYLNPFDTLYVWLFLIVKIKLLNSIFTTFGVGKLIRIYGQFYPNSAIWGTRRAYDYWGHVILWCSIV